MKFLFCSVHITISNMYLAFYDSDQKHWVPVYDKHGARASRFFKPHDSYFLLKHHKAAKIACCEEFPFCRF